MSVCKGVTTNIWSDLLQWWFQRKSWKDGNCHPKPTAVASKACYLHVRHAQRSTACTNLDPSPLLLAASWMQVLGEASITNKSHSQHWFAGASTKDKVDWETLHLRCFSGRLIQSNGQFSPGKHHLGSTIMTNRATSPGWVADHQRSGLSNAIGAHQTKHLSWAEHSNDTPIPPLLAIAGLIFILVTVVKP